MLQLINNTLGNGERLMPITTNTEMTVIASKYSGVRWNEKQKQFEINKQVKGLRDWAYTKNPDEITLTEDNWEKLPITLRYNVMSDILSISREETANFPSG